MENNEQELMDLKEQREKQITRLFLLLIEMIFILGIPAAIAIVIMDQSGHKEWGFVLLPLAFVVSLAILIMRFRQVNGRIEAINKKIKALNTK